MKKKLAALFAIAAVMTSAVSCGHDEADNSIPELPSLSTASEDTTEKEAESETEKPTEAETEVKTTEKAPEESEEVTSAAEEETDAPEVSEADVPEETAAEQQPDETSVSEQSEDPATDPTPQPDPEPQPEPEPEPEPQPIGGVEFSMNDIDKEVDGMISALGAPIEVQTAPACFSNGADSKIYTYDGLTIECYVLDGVERLHSVTITKEGYYTSEGICLGKTRADVEAAYGVGVEAGMYTVYEENEGELSILFSGDFVTEIVFCSYAA